MPGLCCRASQGEADSGVSQHKLTVPPEQRLYLTLAEAAGQLALAPASFEQERCPHRWQTRHGGELRFAWCCLAHYFLPDATSHDYQPIIPSAGVLSGVPSAA